MLSFLSFAICTHNSLWKHDSPNEVTAENKAEYKDEDTCAKNHHVDVQWQVLESDGRHGARFVGIDQSQTTEAS